MNTAVMFSKASDEWTTPQDTFDALNAEFHFRVDAAASYENTKCLLFLSDSLGVSWRITGCPDHEAVWLNPPYSRCREFMAKAALEASKGCLVVALVPSRTDTRWWHESVWDRERHQPKPGVEVRFLKGRLKFGGATAGAPFPSAVVVFRGAE